MIKMNITNENRHHVPLGVMPQERHSIICELNESEEITSSFHEATSEKSTLRNNFYNSRLVFFKILNDIKNKKHLKISS